MPIKSPRGCAFSGCPNLTREGVYCDEHRALERKKYDGQRGTSSQRGYGSRWRKLRKMFLNAHPLCVDPYGIHAQVGETVPATEVDHIVAKKDGGTDEWSNLQGLCKSCHSRKTAREDSRWG